MLKAHRRFPRVKEKLPRQPDKQHGRATTKGYSYYSIARNEKKGAYTMSTNEMTSKIRELKELIGLALFTHAKVEEMYRVKDLYTAYREARGTDTDSLWDIMSLLSFVYDTARIQGIREERARRT